MCLDVRASPQSYVVPFFMFLAKGNTVPVFLAPRHTAEQQGIVSREPTSLFFGILTMYYFNTLVFLKVTEILLTNNHSLSGKI